MSNRKLTGLEKSIIIKELEDKIRELKEEKQAVGEKIKPGLTFEEYKAIARELGRVDRSIDWYTGILKDRMKEGRADV